MKINGVGPGMKPKQPAPGTDARPSPAFASESLKRNDIVMGKIVSMTSTDEANAAFEAWKNKKDKLIRTQRKEMEKSESAKTLHYSEIPYSNYIGSGTSSVRPSTAPSKQSEEAAQHREWLAEKLRKKQKKRREDKAKEDKFWNDAAAEREKLLESRREKLKPHMERKKELLRREREKYKAVTSGRALSKTLASSLKRLQGNPLCVIPGDEMIELGYSKGKKRGKKNRRKKMEKRDETEAKSPSAADDIDEEDGYGDDFEDGIGDGDNDKNDENDKNDDGIKRKGGAHKDNATPTPTPTPTPSPTPTRGRARTFALGLDGDPPVKRPEAVLEHDPKSPTIGIKALKERIKFANSLLELPAGQQYRHRRMVETASTSCRAVLSLRHNQHLQEIKEADAKQKEYEAWVKAHPPKSGVANRPQWDNDFANPESSELNMRNTQEEVKKARDATFRGQFGPGYGVNLDAVPDRMGGYVTHETLGVIETDKVEQCLGAIKQPDILELGSFLKPPHTVKVVVGAVCTLLGIDPQWHVAHKGLLRNSYYFLTMLRFFDKSDISPLVLSQLQYFVNDPAFLDESVLKASRALKQLKDWVVAVYEYGTGVELERAIKRRQQEEQRKADDGLNHNDEEVNYDFDDDFDDKSLPSLTASVENANGGGITISPSPRKIQGLRDDSVRNENSVEDGSYAEIYDDETRSSVHSATMIKAELEHLKTQLQEALEEKKRAMLKFEEAERELSRNRERANHVQEEVDEAEKKAKDEIENARREAEKEMENVEKKSADIEESARKEVMLAKIALEGKEREIVRLQTSAAEKSRNALELASLLAKEKLMRKITEKKLLKKSNSVLRDLLEREADDAEKVEKETVEKELKEAQEKLGEEISKRRAFEDDAAFKGELIEAQYGLFAANQWLSEREKLASANRALEFEMTEGNKSSLLGIRKVEKFYNDSDLLSGSFQIVEEGNAGLANAKMTIQKIENSVGDMNEELSMALESVKKQVVLFESRMKKVNDELTKIFVRLGSGLLKEVKRVFIYAKENGVIISADDAGGDGAAPGYKLDPAHINVLSMIATGSGGDNDATSENDGAGWTDSQLASAMLELGGAFDRIGNQRLGDLTLTPKPNDSNDMFGNAVRCFGIASCFKLNDCDVLCNLAKCYEELGMSDVAIDVVKDSISLTNGTQHAETMYNLATSFESKGDFQKATKIYQRASELAAKDGNVDMLCTCLRSIGVCLDGCEKWKEAAKAYLVASELSPSLPELVSARAISLKNGGIYGDAKKAFLEAKELFSEKGLEDHADECKAQADECEGLENQSSV